MLTLALAGKQLPPGAAERPRQPRADQPGRPAALAGGRRFELDAEAARRRRRGAANHPAVQAALSAVPGRGGRRAAARARRKESHSERLRQHHEGSAEAPGSRWSSSRRRSGKKKVEATAGGGMVTVEANGKQEIVSIKIDREVINPDDAQMLEDLVLAACNEALRKSREMVQAEMGKLTGRAQDPRPRDVDGLLPGAGGAPHRGAAAPARHRTQDGPAADLLPPQAAGRRGARRSAESLTQLKAAHRPLLGVLQRHRGGSLPHLHAIPSATQRTLCVVEEPNDLLALERTGEFRGRYHVLLGALSPLDGIGPEDLQGARAAGPARDASRARRSSSPPIRAWRARPPRSTWPSS